MTVRSLLCVALLLCSAQALAEATKYPLTIHSCNREVTFNEAPKHAVSHDINMTQMMLALGLKSRMAGYSGVSGWKSVTPEMQSLLDGLPELAAKYPSVETLLNANVDFYSATVYHSLGLPTDLFTPIFAISRMAGWTAHVLEQWSDNRIFRPLSEYTGRPYGQKVVPIADRE